MKILDKIYYKARKRKVDEGLKELNTISIKEIYSVISRNCWVFGIEHRTILKDRNILEVIIKGNNKKVFLKFHKSLIVRGDEIISFIGRLNDFGLSNGIYITTGRFSKEARKIAKEEGVNISLEDGFHFIKKQVWMNIEFNQKIKANQLNFYMYIPN